MKIDEKGWPDRPGFENLAGLKIRKLERSEYNQNFQINLIKSNEK